MNTTKIFQFLAIIEQNFTVLPQNTRFWTYLLGIIANIFRNAINYHCAKFHAFIKKWTIKPFFDNNPLDYYAWPFYSIVQIFPKALHSD